MKKHLLIFPATLVLLLILSFTWSKNRSEKTGTWGDWKTVSCYKGIDVRFRFTSSSDGADYWDYEIRSRYNNPVHIGWKITNDKYGGSFGRDWFVQNKPCITQFAVVNTGVLPAISVNNVRFGGEYEDSGPYYSCDY